MEKSLFLSLGSNIEPRAFYLKEAVRLLNKNFNLMKISSLYETEAMDYKNQTDFYNICLHYLTDIEDPHQILYYTQFVEKKMGRLKNIKIEKGPRIIDIDILFFEDIAFVDHELVIPHPSMFERNFVLKPLLEILPEKSDYLSKYNLLNYISRNDSQRVKKIGDFSLE